MPHPSVYSQAELYCAAFDFPVDDEVDWALALAPGAARVLEPMCGNARYAGAFVRRGVAYTGLDASPSMLGLATGGDGVTLVTGDARDFALDGAPFDLGWCPINSIRHLVSVADMRAHLRCMHDHLVPGGVYVVETDLARPDEPPAEAVDGRSEWSMPQPDGSSVEASVGLDGADVAARIVREIAHYRRVRDGETLQEVREVFPMRLLTLGEWRDDAASAGFAIERVFRHGRGESRPEVEATTALESDGLNYYFMLRRD